jgi:hypothetical protein
MAEKAAESGEGMMVENENSELAVVLIIVTRAIVGWYNFRCGVVCKPALKLQSCL